MSQIELACTSSQRKGRLSFLLFDLTDLKSCQQAASTLIAKESQLHIVVANAGIMAWSYQLIDGIEIQVYHHLGHHAFISALLALLLSTPSSRAIILTSNAHSWSPRPLFPSLLTAHLSSFFTRYGQSKLLNLLFALHLSRHHPSLTTLAVHPGPVVTSLLRETSKSYPWARWLAEKIVPWFLLLPEEGARTVLFAACADAVDERNLSGTYLVPFAQVAKPDALAQDEDLAREFWESSERVIRESLMLQGGK